METFIIYILPIHELLNVLIPDISHGFIKTLFLYSWMIEEEVILFSILSRENMKKGSLMG